MEDDHEYLEIEISRQQTSTIFLKVPKDWRPFGGEAHAFIVEEAQKLDDWDWDSEGWHHTLEKESIGVCDKKTAIGYGYLDLTTRIPKKEIKDENQLDLPLSL